MLTGQLPLAVTELRHRSVTGRIECHFELSISTMDDFVRLFINEVEIERFEIDFSSIEDRAMAYFAGVNVVQKNDYLPLVCGDIIYGKISG